MPEDDQALDELRASLLRRKAPRLTPDQGDEAFDQHMLLAIAVHRAARLHKTAGDNDTEGWMRYVRDFFPEGRNSEADALRLWKGWRCTLLKDEQPVVPITHGQPEAHWGRDPAGSPCLNLENVWADYEHSVGRFMDRLRDDDDKRETVLRRFRERGWTVRRVTLLDPSTNFSASLAHSATAMGPPS